MLHSQTLPEDVFSVNLRLSPWQKLVFPLVVIVPVGNRFTVMVKIIDDPLHPFAVGIIVTVAVTGVEPGLDAAYAGIFPVPAVPNPTFADDVQL